MLYCLKANLICLFAAFSFISPSLQYTSFALGDRVEYQPWLTQIKGGGLRVSHKSCL